MGMVYQSLPVTHCPPQKRVVLDSDVYIFTHNLGDRGEWLTMLIDTCHLFG